MNEVELIIASIQESSGYDRQTKLQALWQSLIAVEQNAETIIIGLKQHSNDVRRLTLDALSVKPSSLHTADVLLTPILDVLRQNLQAPGSSLSAIRSAASALKALSRLLNEDQIKNHIKAYDMQSLVEVIVATMAWGLAPPPAKVTHSRRSSLRMGRPGTAFSFDRQESQSSNWREISSQRQPSSLVTKRSFISLKCDIGTSSASDIIESDVEQSATSDVEGGSRIDEGDHERKLRRLVDGKRLVRQRSIACVSSLNQRNAKALLPHWTRLLLEGEQAASLMDVVERDESFINRQAALQAVQAIISSASQAGFLAGAEERNRLDAFTSLSSRTASIIVELRERLLAILVDRNSPPALLEATLKCTRIVVVSTPQVKLRVTHSQVLRDTTLQLCSRPEVTSAVPAYSLLSALVASEKRGCQDSTSDDILATLLHPGTSLQVQIEAWNTMTVLAEKNALQKDIKETIQGLLRSALAPKSILELRQAAANFIQACRSSKGVAIDDALIKCLCVDESPLLRTIAANSLNFTPTQESMLLEMLHDRDSTVRASAVRAIGVRIQADCQVVYEEQVFLLLSDDSLLVRMRASWTFGNLCEFSHQYARLLILCQTLKDDDERVAVNAVRGVGAILARCPVMVVNDYQGVIESILTWLIRDLTKGPPKIRWNAAASLARSFTIPLTGQKIVSMHDSGLLPILARVMVEDSAFKVRLSVVNALLVLAERNDVPTSVVADAVPTALERVRVQLQQATFKEAQLHALPLQHSLERLSVLLAREVP
ncbi:hypothetical protein CBS101457_005217 [Exobasidium rhododendri]|nr:hypothetical protein CBS101457_005217 [Exobasidium rhododendri]